VHDNPVLDAAAVGGERECRCSWWIGASPKPGTWPFLADSLADQDDELRGRGARW
jgi:hypothetical protein